MERELADETASGQCCDQVVVFPVAELMFEVGRKEFTLVRLARRTEVFPLRSTARLEAINRASPLLAQPATWQSTAVK